MKHDLLLFVVSRHLLKMPNVFLGQWAVCVLLWQLASSYNVDRHGADGEKNQEKAGGKTSLEFSATKTIDQIIVEASGGTEAVNYMAGSVKPGGLITAELDMNLTPQQYTALYGHEDGTVDKRKATSNINTRWQNSTIPYIINEKDFSAEEITGIKAAMTDWGMMTCLRFRPASSADKNTIKIQNGNSCNSALGMIGGTQTINLQSPGCRFKGLYLHELGHAIGLVHEHQLPQRDDYITIKYSNVAPNMRPFFNKINKGALLSLGVEYDYASVMHYGKTAFSYNGKAQTIFTRDKSKENLIGYVANKGLSFSDVKTVNIMYKCNETCATSPVCNNPCFVNKDCRCFCKEDMPKEPCVNKKGDKPCEDWASYGECKNNPDYMNNHCAKACGMCSDDPKVGGEQDTEGTTIKAGTCYNDYGDIICEDWASNDECKKNVDWMTTHCQKSCDKCSQQTPTIFTTPTTLETAPDCTNSYGDKRCNEWSSGGQCARNPSFMGNQCRKACGLCPSRDTTRNRDTTGVATHSEATAETTTINTTAKDASETVGAPLTKTTSSSTLKTAATTTTTTAKAMGTDSSVATASKSTAVPTTTEATVTTAAATAPATTTVLTATDALTTRTATKAKTTTSTETTASATTTALTTTASNAHTVTTTATPSASPATTSISCQDNDRRCRSWKIYCGRNSYVINNCHKTCGSC
ncbi:zinc metalloproteinase nas-15-like isoform X2 [Littorina saxatilis]|uniref:zinc metalloproteinase nas-15-like isoform X2 n=1 Tax=Littorina saxatilis TaxID=31220 RepID=UPI0038B52289